MNNPLPESVHAIIGHLSPLEAQLLYDLATAVPKGGVIVEIGSYQGKSTVCLGLGAKEAGAWVYAIDPHDDMQENESTHYGMENHAALLRNLLEYEIAETVRIIAMRSILAWSGWYEPINLLWIDGDHEFMAVRDDLSCWSEFATDIIAVHDSSGHYPDVSRALEEFLAENPLWRVAQTIDATTVLERIHG